MSDSTPSSEDPFPFEDQSRPDDPSALRGERPEAAPGRPNAAPRRSYFDELLHRRVPQVLAGYLGVTWTLFELMQWLSEQYLVSPYLGQALLLGLLLLPAVLVVTYRHGRPGPDRWTDAERWTVAGNVIAAALVLVFVFGGAELGSMVRTVQTTAADTLGGERSTTRGEGSAVGGESSEKVVRQVPKKQFRRRMALFYFNRPAAQ